jgi:hypothetical protein
MDAARVLKARHSIRKCTESRLTTTYRPFICKNGLLRFLFFRRVVAVVASSFGVCCCWHNPTVPFGRRRRRRGRRRRRKRRRRRIERCCRASTDNGEYVTRLGNDVKKRSARQRRLHPRLPPTTLLRVDRLYKKTNRFKHCLQLSFRLDFGGFQ